MLVNETEWSENVAGGVSYGACQVSCRWMALCIILGAANVKAGTPFLDAMFSYSTTSNVVYGTGDLGYPTTTNTMNLTLDLYRPTGAGLPALLPGLIVIHGGGFTTGDKSGIDEVHLCKLYSERGYVAATINYRLEGDNPSAEPGAWNNIILEWRAMNAAVQDAAKAVRWLRAHAAAYNMDPARIAIEGSSAGSITALFEGYEESDIVGTNAQVGAILDLWGALYGDEYLVDANDPPVFIVHGTADTTVPYTNSLALTNQCGAVGLPYEFYPIQGAVHAPWTNFFNDVVNGKTIERHGAEFLFKYLGLLSLDPAAATTIMNCSLKQSTGSMLLSCSSDSNFLYQAEASSDVQSWTTNGMPVAIPGNGTTLILAPSTTGTPKQLFRVSVKPNF
jgi:acetyl esterase/lipase